MKQRVEHDWHRVYSILVSEGGAPESMRASFVYHCTEEKLTEWRFQGRLGFGGKIWLRYDGLLYVNCYSEDETPDRRKLIDSLNAQLAQL